MSSTAFPAIPELNYGYGHPAIRALFKSVPEDFQVDEILGFELDGKGEHVWLLIRKRGQNTDWVARQIARFVNVRPNDVGYSGMKDRQAVTTQWFSIYLPSNVEPDWKQLEIEGAEILQVTRHGRKLRTGTHKYNAFVLTLRDIDGEREAWDTRLKLIAERGVPNYFGEQRFGRDANNLNHAWAMFVDHHQERDRHKRGLYLSAARSMLFNQYLSRRIEKGCWDQAMAGDAVMLDGSRSFFLADELTSDILDRIAEGDLHPTGPLWGKGELPVRGEVLALENTILDEFSPWCQGLAEAGLDQERRALRLIVREMSWKWLDDGSLQVSFQLSKGCFATSVLRELMLPV